MDIEPSESMAEQAPSAPTPVFDARLYRASGTASLASTFVLFIGLSAAAILLGVLSSLVGQWFYLVLIFPLVIGLILGGLGAWLTKTAKVRNLFIASAAGIWAGILAMTAGHVSDYIRFISNVEEKVPGIRAHALAGGFTLYDFLEMQAQAGVEISHHGGKGINLGFVGSWIYWFVEMALTSFLACAMLRSAARAPFCHRCNTWITGKTIGLVEPELHHTVEPALRGGEVAKLVQTLRPANDVGLHVKVYACAQCADQSPVHVMLEQVTQNDKGQLLTKEVLAYTYPGEALPFLGPVSATADR